MTLKSQQRVMPVNRNCEASCLTVNSGTSPPDRTVVMTPQGGLEEWPDSDLLVLTNWQEGDPCELCGEPEGDEWDDVLADFVSPQNRQTIAHMACAVDHGYERA